MTDGDGFRQSRFDLTAGAGESVSHTVEAPVPDEESGFSVAVKRGALEVNAGLADVVDEHGETFSFGSRALAERFAAALSVGDGGLRVQNAAPNDPAAADAYLLAAHDPSISTPAAIDGDTLTFDVGANLYGALGEAVLLHAPKPHALYYFVREDLGLDADAPLHLDVERGRFVSLGESAADPSSGWVPDCVVTARDGRGGSALERYACEVKTGNASFERSQVEAMQRLAAEERVVKVRVLVDDLPDQYALRFTDVEPRS